MREKEDFEKHSAHKMALLQDQLHQKGIEIRDLEEKLKDIVSKVDIFLIRMPLKYVLKFLHVLIFVC